MTKKQKIRTKICLYFLDKLSKKDVNSLTERVIIYQNGQYVRSICDC